MRRSNRKRKLVSTAQDMSKGLGSKKKKTSPAKQDDAQQAMPHLPRTPLQADKPAPVPPPTSPPAKSAAKLPDIGTLLQAMEERLSKKIDISTKAVNEAVQLSRITNDALGTLEGKVDANEAALRTAIQESEERVKCDLRHKVKDLVNSELRSAGFDPDLSAADLRTTMASQTSYAAALQRGPTADKTSNMETDTATQLMRREDHFWTCKRSL